MLSKKMEQALNNQINAELWSAYLYLSMSADFAHKGYAGFAHWFDIQYREEQAHADLYIKYILARGGKVTLQPIKEVRTEWSDLLNAFEDTLQHEQAVTKMINELYDLAVKEKDYATVSFLKFFVDEQVEEEETAKQF
ncbi:MAG: ferritin, partial [Bacteroidales bacterium]